MKTYENKDNKPLSFAAFRRTLKCFIESKGLLQKDFAEEVGIKPVTLSRYINGRRNPDLIYVYKIARYFGVTIDYLLGINDDKNAIFSKEIREVCELYSRASREDQAVINTVLRKYGCQKTHS